MVVLELSLASLPYGTCISSSVMVLLFGTTIPLVAVELRAFVVLVESLVVLTDWLGRRPKSRSLSSDLRGIS